MYCTAVVALSGVRDPMHDDAAARAFGSLNGTLNIFPVLAPLLGGLLVEAFSWRAPFWLLAGYALLVLALRLPDARPTDTSAAASICVYFQRSSLPILCRG